MQAGTCSATDGSEALIFPTSSPCQPEHLVASLELVDELEVPEAKSLRSLRIIFNATLCQAVSWGPNQQRVISMATRPVNFSISARTTSKGVAKVTP